MIIPNHVWYTPEDIARQLNATPHGEGFRACCPAHHGDNPTALSIKEGTDRRGNPCTMIYCHAHQCSIAAICEALGIAVSSLFVVHPTYASATRGQPRSHDPHLERLKFHRMPHSEDDLAQAMLESEMVNDPGFLSRVPPARQTCWRLLQDPVRKAGIVKAFIEAALPVRATLEALREEWGEHEQGDSA